MWAALIAVLIPWVDAISVWRGPTEYVVEEQPQIFDTVSIAFRVPGEDGTANLGPPDILSSRSSSPRPTGSRPRRVDVAGDDGPARRDADRDRDHRRQRASALPAICIGFLPRTPTSSGRRCAGAGGRRGGSMAARTSASTTSTPT